MSVPGQNDESKPKLWVRVVEAHATRTYIALILAVSAGLSLIILTAGAVWNTVANPEITDISANFMTAISGPLGAIFAGLTGYLGYQQGSQSQAAAGKPLHDGEIVFDVDPPRETP